MKKEEIKAEDDDDVFPQPLKLETLAESKPIVDDVLEETLSTPTGVKYVASMLKQYEPLASKYMTLYITDDKSIDKTLHGVRYVDDEWQFGNKALTVDKKDNIYIDNVKYQVTEGLFELIFRKDPDQNVLTKKDHDTYVEILKKANVLKKKYNPFGPAQGSRSKKYMSIIAPHLRSKSGSGLRKHYNVHAPDWIYWNDPNELVEILMLLVASRDAGHTGHDNEILSIIEELREEGYVE